MCSDALTGEHAGTESRQFGDWPLGIACAFLLGHYAGFRHLHESGWHEGAPGAVTWSAGSVMDAQPHSWPLGLVWRKLSAVSG